jgi:hypothetical protein
MQRSNAQRSNITIFRLSLKTIRKRRASCRASPSSLFYLLQRTRIKCAAGHAPHLSFES